MKKKISGIYAIINKTNGKRYIGSSKQIKYRWRSNHIPQLKKGEHYNTHLQHAWNKYGEKNFDFQILEECNESNLVEKEEHWIEHYKSWNRKHGYNLVRYVEGRPVYSEETRRKRSSICMAGQDKEIIELAKNGVGKNTIAKKLGVSRNAVYKHLEHNGLHKNEGKGKIVKLTKKAKQKAVNLREQGMTWNEISEAVGVSETQLTRAGIKIADDKYGGNVNRETYRTVTPEIVEKVKLLREKGMYWEDIEKEVGVSRFALHQNGITQKFVRKRKGEKRRKITDADRQKIYDLFDSGKSITEIFKVTGIPKSTIRLQLKKRQE